MSSVPSNVLVQSLEDEKSEVQNCLVLKSLTQCSSPVSSGVKIIAPVLPQPEITHWPRYIDSLCFLCNRGKAGDAVVSLGCEPRDHKTIFWLATNYINTATAASKLLQNILSLSKTAVALAGADLSSLTDQVCSISVMSSSDKVKNYRSKLKRAIKYIKTQSEPKAVREDKVVKMLEAINMKLENHECIVEESFRSELQVAFRALYALSREQSSEYDTARHMVGRLYSWKKHAQFVIENAHQFSSVLKKFRVEVITEQLLTPRKSIPFEKTVRDTLKKFFGQQGPIMDHAASQLECTQKRINQLIAGDQTPILHAEVAVAHHFHAKRLTLIGNYIGCSKPSCYACKLYLDLHPAGFAPRQQHGNAWPKWYFPTLQDGSGNDDVQATIKLARKMSKAMRKDLERCIHGEQYGRRKVYESFTGMTKPSLKN